MSDKTDIKGFSKYAKRELNKKLDADSKIAKYPCYTAFESDWDKFNSVRFELNDGTSINLPYSHRGKITYNFSDKIAIEFPDTIIEIEGHGLDELHEKLEKDQVAVVSCKPYLDGVDVHVMDIRVSE